MSGSKHARRQLAHPVLPRVAAASFLTTVLGLAVPGSVAQAAQPGATPGLGPGGPPQRQEKKEGPAEEAPKDKQALRPVEPIPAQPAGVRRLQLFELHGYFRLRGDYFHRLNLGLPSDLSFNPTNIDNKFFSPPAETPEQSATGAAQTNDARCTVQLNNRGISPDKIQRRCERRNGFASANLRLRMEPSIHVSDTVHVHAQIDALDNLVLGSTPDAMGWNNPWAPIDLYTRTQTPPTSGINSFQDSILVKRAWGQIRFGFGLNLEFGRMPWHWGMGIVANDGNGYSRNERADIVRMVDQDYGDSVDSVRLSFDFGKDRRRTHKLIASWDWASSGPTTAQLLGPGWASGGNVGQDFSAEKFDNLYQWSLGVERRDSPEMLRRKLSLGGVVVNYGLMNWLRWQNLDAVIGTPGLGDGLGTNPSYYDIPNPNHLDPNGAPLGNADLDEDENDGRLNYAASLVHRRAILYTPDLWFRVNWGSMRVELEAAAQVGRYYARDINEDPNNKADLFDTVSANNGDLDRSFIETFGYALEFKYGLFQDKFHIGLDHGFAMGDESDNVDQNYLNPLLVQNDGRVRNFRFNPAYHLDLLMFRELLGTVSNVTYFKPWAAFYFFDYNFSGRVDIAYAMSQQKASTFGNARSYGIEIDGALRYHDQREPIFIQLQYGVLFPLGAFDRPAGLYQDLLTTADARAAQTVQAQVGIKF